jgi:hypothetical protein
VTHSTEKAVETETPEDGVKQWRARRSKPNPDCVICHGRGGYVIEEESRGSSTRYHICSSCNPRDPTASEPPAPAQPHPDAALCGDGRSDHFACRLLKGHAGPHAHPFSADEVARIREWLVFMDVFITRYPHETAENCMNKATTALLEARKAVAAQPKEPKP